MRFLLLFFSLYCWAATGQTITPQVMSNGGGYTQTPSGSIAWTFAEPISATYFASQKYTTMGFHQTEVEVGTLLNEQDNAEGFVVFPNAVSDFLNLDFRGMTTGNYQLRMHDAAGRLVYDSAILVSEAEKRFSIVMTRFASGTYYLNVSGGRQINKTIQLIKTSN
jgi:hypothetical protein